MTDPVICFHCRHFMPDMSYNFVDNQNRMAKCAATRSMNLVTGEDEYITCSLARLHEHRCGINGRYFELNISDEETNHGE